MELIIKKRRIKLIIAVFVMLFAGIIYAWSIINTPFRQISDGVVTNATQLGINYTLTIIFFCLGGFGSGIIAKHTTTTLRLTLSALMLFTGFFAASLQTVTLSYTGNYFMLYLAYGVLCGLGIGVAYNTVISTINMWYPDKRGFSSGIMLMGFGLSLLATGWLIDILGNSESVGWRFTYVYIAVALGIVLLIAAIFINPPPKDTVFPQPKSDNASSITEETKNYTALEMIRQPSFILIFIFVTILASTGSAAISFARDIVIDAGASEGFAVFAVGLLGISNGFGRLAIGWLFDKQGMRHTQFFSGGVAILAPLTVVMALIANSLFLGVLGLCLCGFSYGLAPTINSVFASGFYGQKNFSLNFSILNLILIPAPFAAMLAGGIKASTGGFMTAFIILTGLTVVGFFVCMAIKKP